MDRPARVLFCSSKHFHTMAHTVVLEDASMILPACARSLSLSLSFSLPHTLSHAHTHTHNHTVASEVVSIYLSARALSLFHTLSITHTRTHASTHFHEKFYPYMYLRVLSPSRIHTHFAKVPLMSSCIYLRALSLTHRCSWKHTMTNTHTLNKHTE